MRANGAKEGVVVTTGKVSEQAREWAMNKPIRIFELDKIVNHIRTHYREDDIVPEKFVPYKSNKDVCPECGSPLSSRHADLKSKCTLFCDYIRARTL